MAAGIAAPPAAPPKDAIRKRRRRAPAGGASDDCFSCAKKNLKCDRRRPYCSQCLEVGTECSGYKTQLTWGVGVASRGKLRGLSLPIAKSAPASAAAVTASSSSSSSSSAVLSGGIRKSSPAQRPRTAVSLASVVTAAAASSAGWGDELVKTPLIKSEDSVSATGPLSSPAVTMPATPLGYEYGSMGLSMAAARGWASVAAAQAQYATMTPHMQAHAHGHAHAHAHAQAHPLMPQALHSYRKVPPHLAIPIGMVGESALSSSLDSVSDVDYMSPLSHTFASAASRADEHNQSSGSLQYLHSPIVFEGNYMTPNSTTTTTTTSSSSMSTSASSGVSSIPIAAPSTTSPTFPPSPMSSSLSSSLSSLSASMLPASCAPGLGFAGVSVADAAMLEAKYCSELPLGLRLSLDSAAGSLGAYDDMSGFESPIFASFPHSALQAPSQQQQVAQAQHQQQHASHMGLRMADGYGNQFHPHSHTHSALSHALNSHHYLAHSAPAFQFSQRRDSSSSISLVQQLWSPVDKEPPVSWAPPPPVTVAPAATLNNAASTASPPPSLSSSSSTPPSLSPAPMSDSASPELLSRMPYLLDYYKTTVCASLVFLDGPANPFRDHLVNLASNSPCLQHAMCALAACNLRMKRRLAECPDARELANQLRAEKEQGSEGDSESSEEFQHRHLAVTLLNAALNDPAQSTHDSVLGTILLLCHYRMVESGIAKFHMQFAGVRKILALRRSRAQAQMLRPTREAAWMEAIFTYFDAISASINNRESQLGYAVYGTQPENFLLPQGCENMVGCDRELFKTISRLGRLNMMAQARPVQYLGGRPDAAPIHAKPAVPLFDGTGSTTPDDEQRAVFWRELCEARLALQNWKFDENRISLSIKPSAAQLRDLASLSECFRHAAILYTERLANPNMPSSHAKMEHHVEQVMCYATSLESSSGAEKFLLWPLFVAGAEATHSLHQNVVRSKVRHIMGRSGYMNNLAALEALESVWATAGNEAEQPKKAFGQSPFNWTRCIGGPGVEVEWIMF